jgi:UDP-glucose 4-epimerase
MASICITGISGYLGKKLVQELNRKKEIDKIIGFDIAPPSFESKKTTFYRMDICSPEIGKILSDHRIDTVFHLAFVVKPIHDLKKMHDIDYNGTKHILNEALSSGAGHFIAISSTLAYGAHPDNPEELTEDHPLRGNRSFPYGFNKSRTDHLIRDFADQNPGMIVTILRPCTVFGPNVSNYVSRMLFRPFTIGISGYNPRVQFLHEDDFVGSCLTSIEKKIPGAFNIVGDGTVTTEEIGRITGTRIIHLPSWILYPLLEALWKLRFPGIEVNSGYLDYARYSFIASPSKAKKILGFHAVYDSLETLRETVRSKKMLEEKKETTSG